MERGGVETETERRRAVTYALAGPAASCDVTVTMAEARDSGEERSGTMKRRYGLIPPSVAHAVRWTSGWRTSRVDYSLPTARVGGRSHHVSRARRRRERRRWKERERIVVVIVTRTRSE